ESEVGKGTTFFIDIPKKSSASARTASIKTEEKPKPPVAVAPAAPSGPKFPEFAAVAENPLDNQVQRDYLKEKTKSTSSSSIDEIKKQASAILKEEQQVIKPVNESKLQDRIASIKKEIIETEAEIQTKFSNTKSDSEKKESKDDFQVSIRKPKLKI